MKGGSSALIAAAALMAQTQTPAPTPDLHAAIGVIAARALERPVAGISIAVARGGTIVEARGFGLADVDRKIAVTPQTVFHAASVSKNILAGVVLHLVEERKLSLDEDITKYVAEAPTHGQHVTVRHLLTHTSGLFSYTSVPNAEANEALDLSHEQVLALIKDRPADFAPGASWRYDNTGFYLVGMAVERVTGMTYAAYLRSRVFEPLGMTSSSLCTVHDDVPALAAGYDVQNGKFVLPPRGTWTVPFAAGSVCTTVSDLVRWQNALDGGRFISRAHLDEMRRPTKLVGGTLIDYGLGTRLGSLQGHAVAGHTGSGLGFNTVLITFPADRLTIAVLTNSGSAGAVTIAAAIARAALGLAPPKPAGGDVPSDEVAALVGRFDSDEGTIEQYACGTAMCFRIPGTTAGGTATRISPFVYAAGPDTEIRFAHPPIPVEWGFVYTGGLFADAKRRVPNAAK